MLIENTPCRKRHGVYSVSTADRPHSVIRIRDNAVPARSCSIAVIDDDLAFAETLAVFSRLTGCHAQVIEPRSVPHVVAQVVDMNADVVFLDIALAHLDGCDVAEALRRRGASMKLVAVTGDWRPETAQRCRRAGFDEVWHKPIDPAQVEAFLDAIAAG